ncbi:hypothetical protein EDD21DRAFT_367761 [Dissophora ornata]|nr:hypothetical protein EDD21DRAFT_367761 [Dissophora ornata]
MDGYSHHYSENSMAAVTLEQEKHQFAAMLKVRNNRKLLEEEFRKKKRYDAQKRKEEEERIQLLQRLRLEDEERRKRELQEKQRKERLEQEMRKKREAAEVDQTARSFLFKSTSDGHVDIVKKMLETTPAESESLVGAPKFSTALATRLTGWEYLTTVEGIGEVSGEQGTQETLLHVAARAGCSDLVAYFISKGAPLDALDSEGRMPLHTAAEYNAPLDTCKLLLDKATYHIDRTSLTSGKTALHYAAQNGYSDLVSLLLQHHARVNAMDSQGNTPEILAKLGLDREKSSKAKAQKYRSALQHIQKAVATIKEAQRLKDSLLEEQRKKEEELAREEAEKDRAARRKQEEKLEADQRRREEEEKELARLKAMTSDPHGNNAGGGGGKKKKKKKGKSGNDSQSMPKEIPSVKALSARTQNTLIKPASPSLIGSPSVTQIHPTQAGTHIPVSPKSSTSPTTISKNAASTSVAASTSIPRPDKFIPETTLSSAAAQSPPSRLPKAKTSYRPSQLLVARMADMGFAERDSRKALIQTEGKFEEAIELLTSGAPLADDSEDEAERAAEEAARQKAKAKETALATPVAKKRDSLALSQTPSKLTVQSASSQAPSVTLPTSKPAAPQQALLSLLSGSGNRGHSPTLMSKGPTAHPVQILQRPQLLAPHVQIRTVPTQVLQRPSPHSQAQSPSHIGTSLSKQGSPTPTRTPTKNTVTSSAVPFLAPRTVPPAPPTRAPYTYGVSSAQNQNQPPSASAAPVTTHSTHYVNSNPQSPVYNPDNHRGSFLQSHSNAVTGSAVSAYSISSSPARDADYGASGSTVVRPTWETQLGVYNSTPIRIAQDQVPLTAQDSLWGTMAQSTSGSAKDANSDSFSRTGAYTGNRRASFELLAASLDEMLRQSQMDIMDGNADEDMIKDVLAMTGAIDPEELQNSLSNYPLATSSGPASRHNVRSTAVGEERTQSASAIHNPVASLWGYGSFTQDISDMRQQWSSSSPSSHLSMGNKTDNDTYEYNQWRSGAGLEFTDAMHQTPKHGSSTTSALNSPDVLMSSYVDGLLGSPGPIQNIHMPMTAATTGTGNEVRLSPDAFGHGGFTNHPTHNRFSEGSNYGQSSAPFDGPSQPTDMVDDNNPYDDFRSHLQGSTIDNRDPSRMANDGLIGSYSAFRDPSYSIRVSAVSEHRPTLSLPPTSATGSNAAIGLRSVIGDRRGTDPQVPSAGIQALNHALEYSRYPKLNETTGVSASSSSVSSLSTLDPAVTPSNPSRTRLSQ